MKYSIGDVSFCLTRTAACLASSSKSLITWWRTISSTSQPPVVVWHNAFVIDAYRAFLSPCNVLMLSWGTSDSFIITPMERDVSGCMPPHGLPMPDAKEK